MTHMIAALLLLSPMAAPAAAGPPRAEGWCDTHIAWAKKAGRSDTPLGPVCPTEGACDVPATRDAGIPAATTPVRFIRLHFVVFAESDGSNPAATGQDIAEQVEQMNVDFAPFRLQFTYTCEFVNDSTFRVLANAEVDPMKSIHAINPGIRCNVFVADLGGALLGRGTFPWDPDALGNLGGIIVDDGAFGTGQRTMTHEMGHTLGLWHTHHGVDEVPACSACYERADGLNADETGDFCSDTPPTPANFVCADPGGVDACSAVPWGGTIPENYMSNAPDACYTQFTAQQAGRMHCWAGAELTGWLHEAVEPAELTGSDNIFGSFGHSVAVDRGLVLVGADRHLHAGKQVGAVYAFGFDGQSWVEQQEILVPGIPELNLFGSSVDVCGNVAVIGAHGDFDFEFLIGRAYVFRHNGVSWVQEQQLGPAGGQTFNDAFGISVGVSGDVVLVGAHDDDDLGFSSGAAHLFRFNGANWVLEQQLLAPDGHAFQIFGISVAVTGNVAVIGAPGDGTNGSFSGAAYVFRFNGATWPLEQKLLAFDGAVNDIFGCAVAASGDVVVVGARGVGPSTGATYVFRFGGASWVLEDQIVPPDVGSGSGSTVAVSCDTAVIGSWITGKSRAYRFDGTDWVLRRELPGGGNIEQSVAVVDDVVVTGSESNQVAFVNLLGDPCVVDLDLSGGVEVPDLLLLLGAWGTNPGGPPDFDGDGTVAVPDLLYLLARWGPCP